MQTIHVSFKPEAIDEQLASVGKKAEEVGCIVYPSAILNLRMLIITGVIDPESLKVLPGVHRVLIVRQI